MKILQVSHGFPPKEQAGVELYTFYLSKSLVDLGHQVHVFCREEEASKEEFSLSEEEVEGLRVTRVANNLTRISDPRIFYDNHFFDDAFMAVLKREKPEIVHFQHFIALSAHLIRLASEEGRAVALTLHDFFLLCHRVQLLKRDGRLCQGSLYGLECASCLDGLSGPRDRRTRLFLGMKEWLPFPAIKWTKRFFIPPRYLSQKGYEVFHRYRFMYEVLKAPRVILTPSRFARDLFLRYYPFIEPKAFALPLGMFPVKPASKRLGSREKVVRFCYFGSVLPHKGLHLLIEAFKSLPEGKAHLTLYGSRNPWTETTYDRLREEARGYSVEFRDPFRREALSEALKDQDVVVLPSIWPETFSLMIREANMVGLPVIASKIGAIPEALQDGVNGLLFEPGNAMDLKRCMVRFIEEPELFRQMASKMPEVETIETHALKMIEIYKGIAAGKRSGTS